MAITRTLLVPFDFSDASHEALKTARDLAPRLGLEIVLLYVYSLPVVVYPGIDPISVPSLLDEVTAAAKRSLATVAREEGGLASIVRAGDPADETLQVIEETKPDLVCMGTHGRRGLARWMLGSVAERVVRGSSVPVLTVRTPPPE